MNRRIAALREWGCDTESAMERMLNDEDFYLECLNDILTDKNFELLIEELKKRNSKAAFDCAHTLKGVLANVGLTPMYQKIVEIVEPLRAGDCDGLLDKAVALADMRATLDNILQQR